MTNKKTDVKPYESGGMKDCSGVKGVKTENGEKRQGRKPTVLSEAYKVFFEAVQSENMMEIVETAWEFFGVPVLVTDENYRLVSMCPNHRIGEEIWDTLYKSRILPKETIKKYVDYYLPDQDTFYDPFYVSTGPAEECPRIFGEIHDKEHIYGHVALFLYDRPVYPEEIECVKVFIKALSMQFAKRHSVGYFSMSSNLLDAIEDNTSDDLRKLAVSGLSVNLRGDYLVMVIPIGNMASNRAFASMAKSQISEIYKESVSATCDNCVVILLGGMRADYRKREVDVFIRIKEHVASVSASVGLSQLFSDLSELRWRYRQALYTSGSGKTGCIFYDDAAPQPIFEMMRRNLDISVFMHPLIPSLRKYDTENNSEYLISLREYALSFRDKDTASAKLNIHRNTLTYRLGRVEDIFGVDLSDNALLLSLLVCFLMEG